MKKFFLTLITVLTLGVSVVNAIPAYQKPVKITLPNGTSITVLGHGDEYNNYLTTTDGYTIVRAADSYFHYAKLVNGELVATDVVAHDIAQRSASEKTFVTNLVKNIKSTLKSNLKRLNPLKSEKVAGVDYSDYSDDVPYLAKTPAKASGAHKNYRGLVILINYNDCEFRMENANEVFTGLMNDKNYTGYTDDKDGKFKTCTGSVRDYFYDNSYGEFDPTFDVYGPYTINKSCTYADKTTNGNALAKLAVTAADGDVDFSQYDSDGDGTVDMFYIIYAGYASSYSGNDSGYLWPYASYISNGIGSYKKDGIKLGRYACSTELYGWKSQGDYDLNGIGTICHEFSHVLGYMDHYDTSNSALSHETPGDWDVMAAGSYNGTCGRTPAGYNAYERITGGFLAPTKITSADFTKTLSLKALNENKDCYRLDTKVDKEYFLLENRQMTKWDSALPGHGMLVWRVDSTDTSLWTANNVNATDRLCFKLIRANGSSSSASQADAFPGSKKVTTLTNNTTANLKTYEGDESDIVFKKIAETDGEISFNVVDPSASRDLPAGTIFYESFNDCSGTGGNDDNFNTGSATSGFVPDYEGWTVYKEYGGDACARFGNMSSPKGYATTPTITLESGKEYTLTFRCAPYYTSNTGMQLQVTSGNAVLSNDATSSSASSTVSFTTTTNQWTDYSFTMTGSGDQNIKFVGTNTKSTFFLDEVIVKEKSSDFIKGDVNGDGEVNKTDLSVLFDKVLGKSVGSFNQKAADINGDGSITTADVSALYDMILGK